jgi:hypothetical protein
MTTAQETAIGILTREGVEPGLAGCYVRAVSFGQPTATAADLAIAAAKAIGETRREDSGKSRTTAARATFLAKPRKVAQPCSLGDGRDATCHGVCNACQGARHSHSIRGQRVREAIATWKANHQ